MGTTWLRSNRRVLLAVLVPCLLVTTLATLLALGVLADASVLRIGGSILLVVTLVPIAVLLRQLWVPRLACRDNFLLVNLRWTGLIRVPLEVVECFLLGQAPAGVGGRRREAQAIVVRLAERATDWARVEVQPILGSWCGGQITLRGTWCEPLDVELVQRLNRQLAEALRATRREVA